MEGLLEEIRSPYVQPAGLGRSLSPLCLGSPLCGMSVSVLPEVQDQILQVRGQGQATSTKSWARCGLLDLPGFQVPLPLPKPHLPPLPVPTHRLHSRLPGTPAPPARPGARDTHAQVGSASYEGGWKGSAGSGLGPGPHRGVLCVHRRRAGQGSEQKRVSSASGQAELPLSTEHLSRLWASISSSRPTGLLRWVR